MARFPEGLPDEYRSGALRFQINMHIKELQKKSSEATLNLVIPEDTELPFFISVFDSDGSIIPGMKNILLQMVDDGLIAPDRVFFHWIDNNLPVKNIPYGMAKKYGYEPPETSGGPENVLVDSQADEAFIDPLIQFGLEVARAVAESLDKEIMGEDSSSSKEKT